VSGFCVVSNFPLRSIIQLSISVTFLVNLIGWRALLAGLAAFTLTMPLNIVVSNKYAAIQNTLMKVRDEKMDIITEAVQGRRQIKFSALERQWQSKISQVRAKELDKQWRVASI
jgi:ABC-type bacteriocin/lantibiotic exporter with double-glycine peptidase domain